jgi:polyhydroxybutyrate depolymerase
VQALDNGDFHQRSCFVPNGSGTVSNVLRRYGLPVVCLALLAAFTMSSGAEARSGSLATACQRPASPETTTRTITVGQAKRTYLLVIPREVPASTPAPVIMGLHGGSGTAENAYRTMNLVGDKPALYVFPQAPYWPEAGGVGWNVDQNGVDFPYFDTLIADLTSRYCVDPHRIFATGKSNGAFMVNALACYRPEMVRAIASVAGGGPSNSQCPGTNPEPVMIIHGSADTTVPIRSAQWTREYWLWRAKYTGGRAVPTTPQQCVAYPGTQAPILWCQHQNGHVWPDWAGPAIVNFFLSL